MTDGRKIAGAKTIERASRTREIAVKAIGEKKMTGKRVSEPTPIGSARPS
jgi:hypothetical protein